MNKNLIFIFFFLNNIYCQENQTNITTQELTVTKSYSPMLTNKNKKNVIFFILKENLKRIKRGNYSCIYN